MSQDQDNKYTMVLANQNSEVDENPFFNLAYAMIGNALWDSRPVKSEYPDADQDLYDCDVVEDPHNVAMAAWSQVCYAITKTLPVEDQKDFAEFVGFGKESR